MDPTFQEIQAFIEGLVKEQDEAHLRLAELSSAGQDAGWNSIENSKDLAQFIGFLAKERDEALKTCEVYRKAYTDLTEKLLKDEMAKFELVECECSCATPCPQGKIGMGVKCKIWKAKQ